MRLNNNMRIKIAKLLLKQRLKQFIQKIGRPEIQWLIFANFMIILTTIAIVSGIGFLFFSEGSHVPVILLGIIGGTIAYSIRVTPEQMKI